VISEKDVFALRRLSMQGITGAIARAEDPASLPALARDIGALATTCSPRVWMRKT